MTYKAVILTLLFTSIYYVSNAQSIKTLQLQIDKVLASKSATVGVAIRGIDPSDTISINGNKHMPLQSVFKFHLSMAMLHQVDKGVLNLNQIITIEKETAHSYKHLWSPLRKKYPDGGEVTLAEMIRNTVAWSDNLGCDILFKLLGGTNKVQAYLHSIGVNDIAIIHDEITMQAEWDHQYDNWTTANASNQTLKLFFENDNLLSKESYNFLLGVLKSTKTGRKSIRGLLPVETIIAHKTGHSGRNDKGMVAALNDIGIVFLPDNSFFYISILVSNSTESDKTNQETIAEISKLAWDYFNSK